MCWPKLSVFSGGSRKADPDHLYGRNPIDHLGDVVQTLTAELVFSLHTPQPHADSQRQSKTISWMQKVVILTTGLWWS